MRRSFISDDLGKFLSLHVYIVQLLPQYLETFEKKNLLIFFLISRGGV